MGQAVMGPRLGAQQPRACCARRQAPSASTSCSRPPRQRRPPVLCSWQTADRHLERSAHEEGPSPQPACAAAAAPAPAPAPAAAPLRATPAARQALERLYRLSSHPEVAPEPLAGLLAPGLLMVAVGGSPPPGTDQEPPSSGNRKQERSPDFYANVGDAIRTLREDYPLLFQRELNYSIYRDDIAFHDPRNTFTGIRNYKLIFWSLRFHGRIFFSRLSVEVQRIWQPPGDDSVIKMRWTVRGVPRVPWEAEGVFDGISSYRLDHEGRIYEHYVDNVLLRDPPLTSPLLYGLNLVPQPDATPCPGAWGMLGSGGGSPAAAAPSPAAAAAHTVAAAAAHAAASHTASAAHITGTAACMAGRPQQLVISSGSDASDSPSSSSSSSSITDWSGNAGSGDSGISSTGSWWPLLVRFSWVRFYAALQATMRLQVFGGATPAPAEG